MSTASASTSGPGHASESATPGSSRLFCLVEGASQRDTVSLAADLAAEAGARLVAISGKDLGLGRRWPWVRRSTLLQRLAVRSHGGLADASPGRVAVRAGPPRVAPVGPDLLIVPAGVGVDGAPSRPAKGLAAVLARAPAGPVLRVGRRPAAMRGWLLPVAGGPGCGGLATGLLRSGLWPSAVSILPVADYRPHVRTMVEAQAELLRAHGRPVSLMRPIDLDVEAPDRIGRFDAAVAGGLSSRTGTLFGSVRNCPLEIVADTVPLVPVP